MPLYQRIPISTVDNNIIAIYCSFLHTISHLCKHRKEDTNKIEQKNQPVLHHSSKPYKEEI